MDVHRGIAPLRPRYRRSARVPRQRLYVALAAAASLAFALFVVGLLGSWKPTLHRQLARTVNKLSGPVNRPYAATSVARPCQGRGHRPL